MPPVISSLLWFIGLLAALALIVFIAEEGRWFQVGMIAVGAVICWLGIHEIRLGGIEGAFGFVFVFLGLGLIGQGVASLKDKPN